MKVRGVIDMLEDECWRLVRQRGGHRRFRHPWRRGTVRLAGKLGVDMPAGTLNSVLKQAGLK